MIGNIYKIVNCVNEKVYIGKTFNSIYVRFKEHLRDSRRVTQEHRKLYSAIRKHGELNFTVELVEENIPEDLVSEKEIEYIAKYDSYHNGYNSTLGGDGKRYIEFSDEEIINLYSKLKSIKGVASELSICEDTVSLILHNNNVIIRDPRSVYTTIKELDITFDTLNECAEYLYNNGYTTNSKIKDIKGNIKRSIKRNGTYLGFTYICTK